jgi:hypothetical protein
MRPGFLSQTTEKLRTLELTRDGMVTLKERRSIMPTRPMKAPLNGDGS